MSRAAAMLLLLFTACTVPSFDDLEAERPSTCDGDAHPCDVQLRVEFQGFRPECVRVNAWDADAPDKRTSQLLRPALVSGPLQAGDKRGSFKVGVNRGSGWGDNLRMSAEGFERGACDAQGRPLAGREPVAVVESGTVATQDGEVGDAVTLSLAALDVDGDGYVAASGAKPGKDCNDGSAQAFPGAPEVCNGLDDNCDAEKLPDDGLPTTPWFLDEDGDGYGLATSLVNACKAPTAKHIAQAGDCVDTGVGAASIHPGATEVCDGIDNNCDPDRRLDEGLPTTPWYVDEDGDSYGVTASRVDACKAPGPKYATRGGDCRDSGTAAAISHPGASEVCDGIDNSCDVANTADEGFDVNAACSGGNICQGKKVCAPDGKATMCQGEVFQETWYPDADLDTKHGGTGVAACAAPAGHSRTKTDCDDGDPFTHNEAAEICDGRDNDCNPATSESDPAVCPSGGGSFVSIATGATGAPFNWRSVVPWGNGGVWMVGEAGHWARRAGGQSTFTTGSCEGSTIWYSLWIDPRASGSVYYGGDNRRLAIQAQNGSTCSTNPPNTSSLFVTRGLMGFTASASTVKLHGVGLVDGDTGKTFTWDGSATSVPLSSTFFAALRDVHGVSESTLFAVSDVRDGLFPIYRYNTGSGAWERQTGPTITKDLNSVYVVNSKLAYAVGETGTVLKWNGANWQLMPPEGTFPSGPLRSVLAFGESSVYVLSQSGNIFRYNGKTWELWATVAGTSFFDIAGTRPDDIWVVGGPDLVYHWPR